MRENDLFEYFAVLGDIDEVIIPAKRDKKGKK